jgi:hypothetical protein
MIVVAANGAVEGVMEPVEINGLVPQLFVAETDTEPGPDPIFTCIEVDP